MARVLLDLVRPGDLRARDRFRVAWTRHYFDTLHQALGAWSASDENGWRALKVVDPEFGKYSAEHFLGGLRSAFRALADPSDLSMPSPIGEDIALSLSCFNEFTEELIRIFVEARVAHARLWGEGR